MRSDEEKQKLNAASEAAMRTYLRTKSWPEKVRSIERMNRTMKTARAAMEKAQSVAQGRAE